MSMKRQCAQSIQDYQKPQKTNRFSPSPIKRYHSIKPAILGTDNKENISANASFKLNSKRPKRLPLQESTDIYQEICSNIPNKQESFAKIGQKYDYSQSHINLSQESDVKKKKMDFENKAEDGASKKRNEKYESKVVEQFHKLQQQLDEQQNQQTGIHSQVEEPSRIDKMPLINNKIDKEIDSLMEATYQDATDGQTGVQYQGRWTQEEHQKFVEGLKMFGKDWRKIEDYIGSRTCAQIRSHAQKYFNRLQREVAKGITSKEASLTEKIGKPKRILQQQPPRQSTQNPQKELPISSQTNQQIQQIHETLSKLAEDDLAMNLRQLIASREQICLEVLLKKISTEMACEKLIIITNKFHQLAMQALQAYKFEICNRMIDERNLTQFTCILFSKQITISPVDNSQGQEIIQHVKLSPRQDSCSSMSRELLGQLTHDRETARSSPQHIYEMSRSKGDHDNEHSQLGVGDEQTPMKGE